MRRGRKATGFFCMRQPGCHYMVIRLFLFLFQEVMKTITACLLLSIFMTILPSVSSVMLSIEKGIVHTENFSLNHIITNSSFHPPAKPSNPIPENFASHTSVNHFHVILTNFFIPEFSEHEFNSQTATFDHQSTISQSSQLIDHQINSIHTLKAERYRHASSHLSFLQTTVLLV